MEIAPLSRCVQYMRGQGRIRTSEVERHWIYSPARLTASVPVQSVFISLVKYSISPVGCEPKHRAKIGVLAELAEGLEPPTCSLQVSCSTN